MVENAANRVIVTKNKTRVVSASGPRGPQGPKGDQGDAGVSSLSDIPDIQLESLNNNDILQYNSATQMWTNRAQDDIVDGGNF